MKKSRKPGHHSGKYSAERQDRRKPRFSRELAIIYEDEAVVAVNKPPGLLAVPVEGSDAVSALSLLNAEMKSLRRRAYVVHRIDRFTSGVLLFAKSHADRQILIRQFLGHTPIREYLAVIRGHLPEKAGTLVHYFRREGQFQKLSVQRDRKAARADLKYSVERSLRDASLVRATLITGLQNQIRVQFSAIGHPVIGDRKYHSEEGKEARIDRVALHAARLKFQHPRSGEEISIECEPPHDLRSLIHALLPQKGER